MSDGVKLRYDDLTDKERSLLRMLVGDRLSDRFAHLHRVADSQDADALEAVCSEIRELKALHGRLSDG